MGTETMLRRYTRLSAVIDILKQKELPLRSPAQWDDINDQHSMNLYKNKTGFQAVFAACFTRSGETYHHWKIFAGENGAYLEFNQKELESHLSELNSQRHTLTYREMKYYYIGKIENSFIRVDELPFIKRKGFDAEKEYRLVASGDCTQDHFPIPLPIKLVKRVVINPWVSRDKYDCVKNIIEKIPGCSGLKVARSRLINSNVWQKAIEQAVERSGH